MMMLFSCLNSLQIRVSQAAFPIRTIHDMMVHDLFGEIFDYSHIPGQAVLHRGRHRHGARATTSGHRINLLLWCRSSVFRELKKYQRDFSSWCGECIRERKERQRLSIAATKSELLRKEAESTK